MQIKAARNRNQIKSSWFKDESVANDRKVDEVFEAKQERSYLIVVAFIQAKRRVRFTYQARIHFRACLINS
jgi:hypothetical protein